MSQILKFVDLNTFLDRMRSGQKVANKLLSRIEFAKAEGQLSKEEFEAIKEEFTMLSPEASLTRNIVDEIAIEYKKLSESFKKIEEFIREADNKGKNDLDFCTDWPDDPAKKGEEK